MADSYNYISQTGVIVPDTADVLTGVENEWKAAFGDDLATDASTPQGVIIAGETSARVATIQNNAKLANQINPNIAGGVFLDALCALLGLDRRAAIATQVTNVLLSGIANTIIPSGSLAKTTNGDVFVLQSSLILDSSGQAYGTFASQVLGPITAPNNALNTPITGILGWETITNNQAGSPASVTTVGQDEETDSQLRQKRLNTLALQGISTVEAQISSLYNVLNVTSVAYLENVTPSTVTINGISLVAHSVWACVDGGTDNDVATSLLNNKTDGAGWNGTTTVAVVEPASGQTYSVKFQRPTYSLIYGALTIKQGSFIGDLQALAPQIVVDYFNGKIDGFAGIGIGKPVSPFEIAAVVVAQCPGCIVTIAQIGTAPGSLSAATIAIAQSVRAQTLTSAWSVTVI